MPRLVPIALLVFMFSCTVANQETSSQDSTAVDSIASVDSATISNGEVEQQSEDDEGEQDTSRLEQVYNEQLELATNAESKYYIVSVRVSQYEGGSDVTWYFDKDLSPRYFSETWSMEGNEGSSEFTIKDGKVVCASHRDNRTEDKWCDQTGGLSKEWNDEESTEPTVSAMALEYSVSADKEFESNLSTLKSILKNGTITSTSPDSYIVRIEEVINVGQEVTEYTEVDIPKVVYDELMR